MTKQRVIVLMGGPSGEHGVSLNSGREVLAHLDPEKYDVKPVTIALDGQWHMPIGYVNPKEALKLLGEGGEPSGALVKAGEHALDNAGDRPDVVFIALHGPYGEDGRVQALLELLDMPYTGSGVAASSLAMDKPRAKALYRAHGLRTPPDVVIHEREWKEDPRACLERIADTIHMPCVCKPAQLGSSVALHMVDTPDRIAPALADIFEVADPAMIEPRLEGVELTCGILSNEEGRPEALPVTAIRPKLSDHFDYASKYTPGGAEEVTPAPISESLTHTVQALALQAHEILGCEGMSRTDFILDRDERLWLLETNTIPGLTQTSLLPQEAVAAGLGFSGMLDRLIADAARRHALKKRPQP